MALEIINVASKTEVSSKSPLVELIYGDRDAICSSTIRNMAQLHLLLVQIPMNAP